MIDAGEYKIMSPFFSIDTLKQENIKLQKKEGQLKVLLVIALIAGVYLAIQHQKSLIELIRLRSSGISKS